MADFKKQVSDVFKNLRRYGFVAQQGIMYTEKSALDFCKGIAMKRATKNIPVPGIVFYTRRMKGNLTVRLKIQPLDEKEETVKKMISEVADLSGLDFKEGGDISILQERSEL